MTVIYPTRDYSDDFQENKPDSLDYDLQSEKQRITEGTEEIKRELLKKWQKQYANAPIFPDAISSVNPELVDFMLSFDLTIFYNDLARKFNLDIGQRDILPQIVWKVVVNKSWSDLENLMESKLGVESSIANQIAQSINQRIIFKTKELSEKPFIPKKKIVSQIPEIKILKLPLSQALQKYPKTGEQLVTSSPIKLKIFPDPVRPSVKNWIAEYHAVLGAGSHGTMERGNFLYHSDNARRLSFGERQKLAVILKSLDENEAVAVDGEKQEIIFNLQPTTDNLQRTAADKTLEARSSKLEANSDFRFSYPQKLQSEQPRQKSYQHFDPYHIDPVGYPEEKLKPEPPPPPPVPPRPEPRVEGNVVDLRG